MHDVKQRSSPSRLQAFGQRVGATPWVAVAARVLVGGLFVFAGISKLLLPHGEVMALVKQYQVIPDFLCRRLPPAAVARAGFPARPCASVS